MTPTTPASSSPGPRVLLYSDDRAIRDRARAALGPRLLPEAAATEYVEVATAGAAVAEVERGAIDLVIADGETAPLGGMGLARQLRDEIEACPPIIVLLGRRDDRWLARWSGADGAVPLPVEPFELSRLAADLLEKKRAGTEAS
ncbi:response regulator transcription factor [Lolliginicoccus suaedae]|uniref:response regulator transcription factor n=1 Tax=Lolliginicoccus suaedae TaxID=2605429 RepID=UPI0011EFBD69|nr:response regulator transcription factor [Lolliginicoccus suaedae]